MKKISLFIIACVAMLGLASCESTTDPKLQIPEAGTFVLNPSPLADQYLQLADGQNFELVCSQPDYGVALVANYKAEVSLDDKFTKTYQFAPTSGGATRMIFRDKDLASAMTDLFGMTDPDDAATIAGMDAQKVWIRVIAQVGDDEATRIVSNPITLNHVKFFYSVPVPREYYIVGTPAGGWVEPIAANAAKFEGWTITETGVETGIFEGTYPMPAGDQTWRIYTELNGWGDDGCKWCLGHQAKDEGTVVEMTDGVYEGACVYGKGSWTINFPAACNVKMTVNINTMQVKFEIVK